MIGIVPSYEQYIRYEIVNNVITSDRVGIATVCSSRVCVYVC